MFFKRVLNINELQDSMKYQDQSNIVQTLNLVVSCFIQ